MDFKEHELSKIIPSMSEEEYRNLKEDIKINGLNNPITLYEEQILDGRHRFRACRELKIEIRVNRYNGSQPLTYIISQNIKRRHLTKDQLGAIGVEILPKLEEEAKKRQEEGSILGGKTAGKGRKKTALVKKLPKAEKGKSTEHAAKLLDVNRQYISDAKKIREKKPETFEAIKEGRIKISNYKEKKRFLKLDTQEQNTV